MDTEELLRIKNIEYRYSGADLLVKCLNPEHEDSNPSMRIDKLTGKFNCFSCGYSGGLFALFNEEQNLLNIKVREIKEKINKLNKPKLSIPLNATYYNRDYRNIRGSTFEHFNAFTVIDSKDYEGRLVFPITNISGEVILFHARYLHSDNNPKYINLPSKTAKPLYPAAPDEIIKGSIILVEGFFDMLNLWDKGLKNTVCVFGSTLVSKSDRGNVKLVHKFSQFKLQGVNKLVLLFDGDKAGVDGSKKLARALKNNYIIENLEIETGKDPGDLTLDEVTEIREYLYGKDSDSR